MDFAPETKSKTWLWGAGALVLALALLGLYFYYPPFHGIFKKTSPTETPSAVPSVASSSEVDAALGQRFLTGTIAEISEKQIKVKSFPGEATLEEWTILVNANTAYQIVPADGGAYKDGKFVDFKVGDPAIVWTVGKASETALTAEKIIKLP